MLRLPDEYRLQIDEGKWVAYDCPYCTDIKQRFCVKYTKAGWYYHCFKCHPKVLFHSALKGATPRETLSFIFDKVRDELSHEDAIHLPEDYQIYLPAAAREWLNSYRLTIQEVRSFNIGYSPKLERIIFPCFKLDALQFWQGRYIGIDGGPKYITRAPKGERLIYPVVENRMDTLVLVEDIISAIKVGRVADCYSLLGSFVDATNLLTTVKAYARIIIWLDYDKLWEAHKYAQRLKLLSNLPVETRSTTLDPKFFSTEEIRRIIYDYA